MAPLIRYAVSKISHDSLDAINTAFFLSSSLRFMINCLEDFLPLEMSILHDQIYLCTNIFLLISAIKDF